MDRYLSTEENYKRLIHSPKLNVYIYLQYTARRWDLFQEKVTCFWGGKREINLQTLVEVCLSERQHSKITKRFETLLHTICGLGGGLSKADGF